MIRASELERRRLNDTFAELCAIPSPSGSERAVAERVAAELRGLGIDVAEDGAAAVVGGDTGNLLARLPGSGTGALAVCAHLDTVPVIGPIQPVQADGGWSNEHDAILGADNKAAVAVLLGLAHRWRIHPFAVDVELLFTVGEEVALAGAKAFDVGALRARQAFVFDHASPIGEIITASPTYFRVEADFHGRAAHAGIQPEAGSSAVLAASRAVAAMPLGRLDEQTTANVGTITGGDGATNVVPERCRLLAEARSLDPARVEAVVAELVDRCQDAANLPECSCDLDVTVERQFSGYRLRATDPGVLMAQAALRRCGHDPRAVDTGGGSDANAFLAAGLACVNLANGTERPHEPTERVSVAALEQMLDVALALVEVCAEGPPSDEALVA